MVKSSKGEKTTDIEGLSIDKDYAKKAKVVPKPPINR
jgi:hypothetical protein